MNTLVLAICSCIIYVFIQYIDRKLIKKQDFDSRTTFKTSAFMFVSIMIGSFIYEQLDLDTMTESVSSITEGKLTGGTPKVFTDNPGF